MVGAQTGRKPPLATVGTWGQPDSVEPGPREIKPLQPSLDPPPTHDRHRAAAPTQALHTSRARLLPSRPVVRGPVSVKTD